MSRGEPAEQDARRSGSLRRWLPSGILGMNGRNLWVEVDNPKESIRLVNDKIATKRVLLERGVPVAPTLAVVRDRRDLAELDWRDMPSSWAAKPNRGRRGSGIVIAERRNSDGESWVSPSGWPLSVAFLSERLRYILDGDFSMDGTTSDVALFEPLLRPHPTLAALSPSGGLPDIRVVVYQGTPILAMMRLPTKRSDGRANLHQGAIGVALDVSTGRALGARVGGKATSVHPDTGATLDVVVPYWSSVVDAASECYEASGLGYLGADVVIDAELGPLILEVNARPGLEIQNVTGEGLRTLVESAKTNR